MCDTLFKCTQAGARYSCTHWLTPTILTNASVYLKVILFAEREREGGVRVNGRKVRKRVNGRRREREYKGERERKGGSTEQSLEFCLVEAEGVRSCSCQCQHCTEMTNTDST